MESFGKRLARLRADRGWSQKELARRSGVPYMTIYRLEEGIYEDTRTATAVKLAQALGTTMDYLCGMYSDLSDEAATEDHSLSAASSVADGALIAGGIA